MPSSVGFGHLGAEIADELGRRGRVLRVDPDQHAVERRHRMHRREGRLAVPVEARRRIRRDHVGQRAAAFRRSLAPARGSSSSPPAQRRQPTHPYERSSLPPVSVLSSVVLPSRYAALLAAGHPMAGRTSLNSGRASLQASTALGQRGWNTQPDGRIDRTRHLALAAAGTRAPPRRADRESAPPRAAPGCRDAAGCRTARRSSASSTMRPRYITATRWQRWRTTDEIVGDEEIGEAEPLAQVLEQVDDLRLDRHVERRHRLVADDELRLHAPARGRCRRAGAGRPTSRADSGRRTSGSRPHTDSSSARLSRRRRGIGLEPMHA